MASTTCSVGCRPISLGIHLAERSQETRSSTPHCRPRICTPSTPRADCNARKGSHSKKAWLGLCKSSNAARQLTTASKCKSGRERVAKGTTCAAAAQGNGSTSDSLPAALLFDCDGVLVDTERDGHRVAFNETFKEKGLQVDWDVQTYGKLLEIGGGKERMTHYFNQVGWPSQIPTDEQGRKEYIAGMHKRKTEIFMRMVESGAMPLRPGVARLVDEVFSAGVPVAVCSTSNEKAVSAIVRVLLGAERAAKIRIFAGDVVPKKKPDPAIYNLAAGELNVDASRCVVIEDSFIGLAAAKAAGMTCVVTKSVYTGSEDFTGADAVYESIGDAPSQNFGLRDLAALQA